MCNCSISNVGVIFNINTLITHLLTWAFLSTYLLPILCTKEKKGREEGRVGGRGGREGGEGGRERGREGGREGGKEHTPTLPLPHTPTLPGYKLSNKRAIQTLEQWKKLQHSNVVSLKEMFTTKAFRDNCEYLTCSVSRHLHPFHLFPPSLTHSPSHCPSPTLPLPPSVHFPHHLSTTALVLVYDFHPGAVTLANHIIASKDSPSGTTSHPTCPSPSNHT